MHSVPRQRPTLRRWAELHAHECEMLDYEAFCRLLVSRRRLERENGADFRGLRDPITGRCYWIAVSALDRRTGASAAC